MPKLVKNQPERFTILNNEIFSDRKLGGMERGVLCTMLSLPDNWNFSIKGLAAILPDGETKIRTALKKLEKAGYLIRRRIYKDGKIVDWEYIISDRPMLIPDDTEDSEDETAESNEDSNTFLSAANLDVANLDVENLHQDIQVVENKHDYKITNNKISKNKISSDKVSINQSTEQAETAVENVENSKEIDGLIDDYMKKHSIYTEIVRENIDYTNFVDSINHGICDSMTIKELDELVASIVRAICSHKKSVSICGQDYPQEIVKSTLLKVDRDCIENALETVKKTDDIRNIERYFISTLFNEVNSHNFKSNNESRWAEYAVKRDFGY